jgi:hypothetical protein
VESYTLGDPQAGPGDTEEMSREPVEAYLRLLAEEELRRPAWPRRVRWAAELLIAMGALDDEVADRVVRTSTWPCSPGRRPRHRRAGLRGCSGYRGMHPNKGRWPPLTTVSTEPGLQAGSHDLP